MARRANAHVIGSLCAGVVALAAPALGSASSGGSGLPATGQSGLPGGSPSPLSSASPIEAQPYPGTGVAGTGSVTITASGNGFALSARASTFLRQRLLVTGTAPARDAGAEVQLQRLSRGTGRWWAASAQSRVRADGSFAASWRTDHIGRFTIRAVISRPRHAARVAVASPALTVTIYRPAIATVYGPGFWGHITACGETLHHATLGVANRTLRCGTPVALYYGGHTIVVPVIDRGPYADHASWDLTLATARRLKVTGTATVGAAALPVRR